MSKRITFLGPINGYTGYGLHSIQVIRDIEKISGAYVSVRPLSTSEAFGSTIPMDIKQRMVAGPQPEEWELLLHPPNFRPTPGKKTAYFTMWESSRLPATGAPLLNKAEVVIVPSVWNATCFSACGVNVPIRVVQLGINTEVFRFRPLDPPSGKPFVFGAAGRLAHGGVRKGLNEVIDLFLKAFPSEENVRLRIKCHPDCQIMKFDDSRIEVTAAHLSEPQLSEWFAGINCFASAARGEGWGLMQQQAMATGRPLISVNFGGISEFFSASSGYPVEYRLENAENVYSGCGVWARPVDESFIDCMRRAYNDQTEGFQLGVNAAIAVESFSWENSNRKLTAVLKEFGAL